MPLNEEMNWNGLEDSVRNAFQLQFGLPTKELLPAGMRLYRMHTFESLSAPGSDALPAWWSPRDPYKNDADFEQRIAIAQHLGVSFREWVRVTSAISEDWSSLRYVMTVTLAVPVYGWFGGFSAQERIHKGGSTQRDNSQEKRGGKGKLPGGGTQFYIPNLRRTHIREHSIVPS